MFRCTLLLTVILILHICDLAAQKAYKGKIVDAKTNQPIPYVNIGIVDKGVGTVSDEEGVFYLAFEYDEIANNEIIQFSSLGYQKIEMKVSNAKYILNKFSKIEMFPANILLSEVVVSDAALVPVTEYIGYRNDGQRIFGYWKENMALGAELCTKISSGKGKHQLNSLEFEVWENPSDSLLLRINIYDNDGVVGRPKTNLNTSQENILYTLKKEVSLVNIDLTPFDIYVDGDFFVSLELLKVYGDTELALVLAASDSDEGSYRKYASQDKWHKISDTNMAYYLESSKWVSQKKARKIEAKIAQAKLEQRKISGFTIFSGSMLPEVTILNKRTKETAVSNNDGRYSIHADKKDILLFSKKGYKNLSVEIDKKDFVNVPIRLESDSK